MGKANFLEDCSNNQCAGNQCKVKEPAHLCFLCIGSCSGSICLQHVKLLQYKAKPSRAPFGSADPRRANFSAADMRELDFGGSTFNGAYLENITLLAPIVCYLIWCSVTTVPLYS